MLKSVFHVLALVRISGLMFPCRGSHAYPSVVVVCVCSVYFMCLLILLPTAIVALCR